MLVLKRNEGQWIEVRHRSGDLLRIKVTRIRQEGSRGVLNLAFEDQPRHFEIRREENPKREIVPLAGFRGVPDDETPAASRSPPGFGIPSG